MNLDMKIGQLLPSEVNSCVRIKIAALKIQEMHVTEITLDKPSKLGPYNVCINPEKRITNDIGIITEIAVIIINRLRIS